MSGRSVIPRGISRYIILALLSEKPMTGKEIIEEAERMSGGVWRPSPGLVYPLLGKLLSEGLIEEAERGYKITEKGRGELLEYLRSREEFEKRFGWLVSLFLLSGKSIVDGISTFLDYVGRTLSSLGYEERAMYRRILERELERLRKEEEKAKRQ